MSAYEFKFVDRWMSSYQWLTERDIVALNLVKYFIYIYILFIVLCSAQWTAIISSSPPLSYLPDYPPIVG